MGETFPSTTFPPRFRRALFGAAMMLLALICAPAMYAQAPSDSATDVPGSWYAFPTITYAPEISLGGGAAAGFFRASETGRPTSVQGDVLVTLRGQYMLNLNAEVYTGADRLRATADISLQHFPDVFYGIGPNASTDSEEDFTSRFADTAVQAEHRVTRNWRVGVRGRFWSEDITEVAEDGLLDTMPIAGREGSSSVGVGLVTTWDSRDRVFFARRGSFVEMYATVHPQLAGTDAGFSRGVVDARQYMALGSDHVLALQGYAEAVSGRAPMSLLPKLGGMQRMRGYREGRYRDNVLLTAQAEWRFPIVWRLSGAVFGSVGGVAPHFDRWAADGVEQAAGAGIRYRLNEQGVHIRFDYAVGREGAAFYLTALQPF